MGEYEIQKQKTKKKHLVLRSIIIMFTYVTCVVANIMASHAQIYIMMSLKGGF